MWVKSGVQSPNRFLADDQGEFKNKKFRDICESLLWKAFGGVVFVNAII